MIKLLEQLSKISSGLVLGLSLFLASLGGGLVFHSLYASHNVQCPVSGEECEEGPSHPPYEEDEECDPSWQESTCQEEESDNSSNGDSNQEQNQSSEQGQNNSQENNQNQENNQENEQDNSQDNYQDNNQNTEVDVGGNQEQYQSQNTEQSQSQSQEQSQSIGDITQNVTVNVTAQVVPQATVAAVPQAQPVTGVAGWTLISMSGMGPLGLLVRRYGLGKLNEVEENPQEPNDIWVLRENQKLTQKGNSN